MSIDFTLTPTRVVEELNLYNLFIWASMITAVGVIGYMPSRKLFKNPVPKIIGSILIGQITVALTPALCYLLRIKFSFASAALLALLVGVSFSVLVNKSVIPFRSRKDINNNSKGADRIKGADRVYKSALVLQLLVFVLIALWVAVRGVHHYDYTYYHNLLSRSLAYSGTIYDNYLLEIRYGFWYPTIYGLTVVMDAVELSWAETNSQIWWFVNALVLPLLFLMEANRKFGSVSCVASLPFTIFLTYQTLVDPRPHYIFAGILGLSFIYFMSDSRYKKKMTVAKHLSSDDFLFLFFISSLLFVKRESIVYLIFIPIWFLLRIGRTNFRKSLLCSSLIVLPIFLLRFATNSSAGIQVGSGGYASTFRGTLLDTLSLALNYSLQNLGGIHLALLGFFLSLLSLSRIKFSRRQALEILSVNSLSILIFLAFIAVTVKAGTVNDGTTARKVPYLIAVSTALLCFVFSNIYSAKDSRNRRVKNQTNFEQLNLIDWFPNFYPVVLYAAIPLFMVSYGIAETAQNFRLDRALFLGGEESYVWMKQYSEHILSFLSSKLFGEDKTIYFYPIDEQTDFNTNTFRGNQVTPQGFLAATHPVPVKMLNNNQELHLADSLIISETVSSVCPPYIRSLQENHQFKFYYLTNSGYQIVSKESISFNNSTKIVAVSPEYEVDIENLPHKFLGLRLIDAYNSKLYHSTFIPDQNQQPGYSSIRIQNHDNNLSLSRLTLRLHPVKQYRNEFPKKIEVWSGERRMNLRDQILDSSYGALVNPIMPDLIHVPFNNVPEGDSEIEIRLFHGGNPSSYNGLINLWFFDLRIFATCK